MGKHVARVTALGFTLAASAALAAPGPASAATSPTLGGDCQATLQNGGSTGLLLDAGAPLNAPNQLTVGLDSGSRNTNGTAPLLTLPLGDTVKALGIGRLPLVGDLTAQGVCPVAQHTVNAVGGLTQGLAAELPPPLPLPPGPNPPEPAPPGPNPPGPNPPSPNPPSPGPNPPGSSIGPVLTGQGSAGLPGDAISGIFTNAALLPGNLVQVPVIAQIIPGQQIPPPTVDAQKSGTAEALPGVTPPAKLPMLLAVLALAVVAAALVRAWIRRSPA
ncbi:hypothetical protein Q5425_40265 [Amycolatopsis sp. A133]|uniref:hypothetical protein n=1 Tax=Amycolatopsis sp. A133 TaxID=3064472 RepID=UPI0027FDE79E|nr:hypothetical protein [Amycolatopsis sp. A133]MDQ7809998.1 hypothetical protein [Amycolatopsis sp. A133]